MRNITIFAEDKPYLEDLDHSLLKNRFRRFISYL